MNLKYFCFLFLMLGQRLYAQDTLIHDQTDKFKIFSIGKDGYYTIFSETNGKIDTIYSNFYEYKSKSTKPITKFIKCKLYDSVNLQIIAEYGGDSINYGIIRWNGNKWEIIGFGNIGFIVPQWSWQVEAIDCNKIQFIQRGKKILIEYDMEKRLEKRTEIKE